MPQQRRRSGFIIGLVALGLLAGAALTAGPAQAVDAPGPYYAAPAWDQKFPAPTRFVVLTNWNSEAVLDTETGLVWERSPATTFHTWTEARLACTARTTGDRKGWRLPSVHELASLVHPSGFTPGGPTLQPGHPFVIGPSSIFNSFLSATTSAENPTGVWAVSIFTGVVHAGNGSRTISRGRIWCVRGGIQADAY